MIKRILRFFCLPSNRVKTPICAIEEAYRERMNDPQEDKNRLAMEINAKLDCASKQDRAVYYKLYIEITNAICAERQLATLT